MEYYIYNGGLPTHPFMGMRCTIEWLFSTDSNYGIVLFVDLPKDVTRPPFEVVDIRKLTKETK